jgi:DNA invertase Pin-like site-specific DNA recombinase
MPTSSPSIVAYSYVRFSSKKQADGDSLRRQTEPAEAYCKRKGWILDTGLNLRDLGVSAFRGDNALVGNLRNFLDAVKRGTVTAGSVLIVESIDRISRQGIDEGYDLIKGILKKGIRLVTLSPEREFGADAVKSLSKGSLEIQLILERAAEESERKSERVRAAWHSKREAARCGQNQPPRKKDGRVTRGITDCLPAWVEEQGGKLHPVPERVAVVKKIFLLAAAGYGISRIVKRLDKEGVPPFGQSDHWTTSYVGVILRDRRVLGEYQPRDRHHKPDGEAIAGYFPAAVGVDEWRAARAGAAERKRKLGRIGEFVNVFAGLLTDARSGKSYMVQTRNDEGGRRRVLIPFASTQGKTRCEAFPLETFTDAVLSCLRELDPHEVLNGGDGPDETLTLSGQLAEVETELSGMLAFMEREGFSPTLGQRVKVLEARKAVLGEELEGARHRARHPAYESWGEMRTLLDVLKNAPDQEDIRTRLRSALRRLVESIVLLVVPRGRDRLCAAQVHFAGGKHRDYLVYHRSARGNRWGKATVPGGWWARSFAAAEGLDLRQPADAKKVEGFLQHLDLDAGD